MKVSEMKKSVKTENAKEEKPEIKKEETPKNPERQNATWWWVRKDKCVPEVALYGTFNDGKGFKLICEDDKLYQESDFVQIYGMAINPFLLEIYKKIKDKKFDPHILNEEESLVMGLFQCKRCIVELILMVRSSRDTFSQRSAHSSPIRIPVNNDRRIPNLHSSISSSK